MSGEFPVTSVEGFPNWFDKWNNHAQFRGVLDAEDDTRGTLHTVPLRESESEVEFIRQIYDKKIGELGTHWSKYMPIDFKYAKIKMGDVIDYYTTKEDVLQIPAWASFKFAVDEYLEEAPAFKFHPSRVSAFIEENGVEQLDHMK